MHPETSVLARLAPDAQDAGLPTSPRLVATTELTAALGQLADAPPAGETIVELDAPPAPALRDFLRERGHQSGGWLNRSWSLPLSELGALADVAAACGPQPARVYRHSGDGAGSRLWVTGGARREPPRANDLLPDE